MEGLTEGRIVHYVLATGDSTGQHRPAIIVKCWRQSSGYMERGVVNLQVFTDFTNDGEDYVTGNVWRTSVPYSERMIPGTWHWIEKA